MEISRVKIEGGRIFRFSLVGICATFVYILVSILANEILRITPVPTSILAQVASFVVSYFGHSAYSFRVESRSSCFPLAFCIDHGPDIRACNERDLAHCGCRPVFASDRDRGGCCSDSIRQLPMQSFLGFRAGPDVFFETFRSVSTHRQALWSLE